MTEAFLQNLEFLLRIFLAGVCGGLIGYERKNRRKEAGVRTHMMVALASSLMMVVSKYGFNDILGEYVGLDPSRVAAGIVTGVGFLGAGMIFVRKHAVNGLTTSAGMWATVGVGMAVGAGMYTIGIVTTVLIVILQVLLHRRLKFLQPPNLEQICVKMENDAGAVLRLKRILEEQEIQVGNIKMEKLPNGMLSVELAVWLPEHLDAFQIIGLMQADDAVQSFEL